ncbi:MAG: tetratricopeptide repeat protein [Acidobacteria bacterium]|nr:tetratricopeptide repeat protein [Acidobacteriota bacterium]
MITLGILASASPVVAQAIGSLRGKIVNELGEPVPEAEVVFTYLGDLEITVTVKTNDKGEFARAGLRTGSWRMDASKGDLSGTQNVSVNIAAMTPTDDLVIKPPVTGTRTDTSGMSDEDIKKKNALMEAMQVEFNAAVAGTDTDPAASLAVLIRIAAEVPDCALCSAKIGNAHMKLGDEAAAEASYKQAIVFDPELADSYSALATLYNQQQKFEDAMAMSQKANALLGTSTTGGDPANVFNQGIIFWNQGGKAAEAKAEFERALTMDPTMAEAHYWFGMASINLGQIPDAVKGFEAYLKLAPTGEFAKMATDILKQIK